MARNMRDYVVRGADKEDARRELTLSLAIPSRDADEYLDFESIREIVPESKSWRQEIRDQLFGPSSPAKPVANWSRS
jgi:hypothetical protein